MNRPTYLSLLVLSGLIGLTLVRGPTPLMLDFHANLADVTGVGQSTGPLAFLFPGAAWGASKCRGEGQHCSNTPSQAPSAAMASSATLRQASASYSDVHLKPSI
jgi:hypothetical protein